MSTSGGSETANVDASVSDGERITYLHPDDVMLGRGRHIKHVGNSRFRSLVQARVVEYTTCRNKSGKDAIAREIIQTVRDRGGRFVRRVVDDTTATTAATTSSSVGITNDNSNPHHETTTTTQQLWEIADDATVLVKVKQTFRDYSVVARKAAAASSDEPPHSRASLSSNITHCEDQHQQEPRTDAVAQQQQPSISSSAMIDYAQAQPPYTNAATALSSHPSSSFPSPSQLQQWVHTIQQQQLLAQLQQQRQQLAQQERLISLLSQQQHPLGSTTTTPSFAPSLHSDPFSMTNTSTGMSASPQHLSLPHQHPIITAQTQPSLTQFTGAAAFPHIGSALNPFLNNTLDLDTLVRLQSSQSNLIGNSNRSQTFPVLGASETAETAPLRTSAGSNASSASVLPILPQNPTTTIGVLPASESGNDDGAHSAAKKASRDNQP